MMTISKSGILHSLSGTMATSELAFKDTVLILIRLQIALARPALRRKGFGY
jgi:hypothetical protein